MRREDPSDLLVVPQSRKHLGKLLSAIGFLVAVAGTERS